MSRAIISGASAPSDRSPAATGEVPAAAAAAPAPEATPETPDALAGALPAWDLLPLTPFIRRVK